MAYSIDSRGLFMKRLYLNNYLSYYKYVELGTIYFGSASDLHLSPELRRLPVIMEYEKIRYRLDY